LIDDIDMYRVFYGNLPKFKLSQDPQTQGRVNVILASVDLSLNTSFSMGVYESRED